MKQSFVVFSLVVFFLTGLNCAVVFDDLAGSVHTFWNDSNGLPSNSISDIVQDETGYIWLASYDGLIRFDGLSFTEFTKSEYGFTGTSPRVLKKGNDNSLWIGTNTSGLYNYKKKKFIHYGVDSGLPDISIRAINIDENNRLYVGTAGGIAYLNDEGQFIPFPAEVNAEVGVIAFILPVKDSLWIGSNLNGIKVIKDGHIATPSYLKEIEKETFSAGYLDMDGSIWLGASSGKIFQIKNEKIKTFDFEIMKSASINGFVRLKSGTLFVASYRGLGRFTENGFDLFTEKKGLPDKLVSGLCQDKEGNLWIAMKNAGVGKFSRGKFLDITKAAYLPPEAIHSVLEDLNGNIWSTSDNGVTCLIDTRTSEDRANLIRGMVEKLKGVRVRQVREDADGTLFFATYSEDGLIIFHTDGKIESINQKLGLASNRVRFSYRDATGIMWIGTTAGLAYYTEGKVNKLTDDVLPNSFILSALRDHNGTLWVGTDGGGVAKFRVEDGEESKLKLTLERIFNNENGLDGNIIFKIVEDSYDNIWFATSTGLSLFRGGNFYSASSALGNINEQVFNFVPDSNGNAWIIEPRELYFLSINSFVKAIQDNSIAEDVVKYNKLDGIAGQAVANSWPCLTASNKLFIPTSKGVSLCDPHYGSANILPPPVVIERVVIDDRSFEAIWDEFKVSPKARRVNFKFTALSYTVPERVRFEYMLEGYDKDWLNAGSMREIAYTNLSSGRYVFKVRASNNGIVNKTAAEVSFYKAPLFYQTIWFYIFICIFTVALLIVLIKLKLYGLKKKTVELDALLKNMTQELEGEKEKYEKLIANVLPPFVLDEMLEGGKSKPNLYPSVSVLFVSVANFTQWASENTSEDVVLALTKIFGMFDEIVDKAGAQRIKTIGGGYLACCGFKDEASHAEKLVNVAIEMLKRMDAINKDLKTSFKLKIAIDSGAITAGIVGEQKYMFDIFGEVADSVFELLSITSPMAVTISSKTAILLDGKFPLYKRPDRMLKGKEKIEIYYLIYRSSSSSQSLNVASSWNSLKEAFKIKDYKKVKTILDSIDATLLEPEDAIKIPAIRSLLAKENVV